MRRGSVQQDLINDLIDNDQLERYARQIIMPEINEEGQEFLLKSKVAIIGAGGLGCPTGLFLAGAGVGEITIVDNDIIDISNLNRQIAFNTFDIGETKSKFLHLALKKLNPEIDVKYVNERLTNKNIKHIFKNKDVIIDCTDNYETRSLIAKGCYDQKIPMSFGSAVRQEGQTAFFIAGCQNHLIKENHDSNPCYMCLFPDAPEVDIISGCSDAGILGPITGLISSIQSLNVIRYLTKQTISKNLLLWDGLSFLEVKVKKSPDCQTCS